MNYCMKFQVMPTAYAQASILRQLLLSTFKKRIGPIQTRMAVRVFHIPTHLACEVLSNMLYHVLAI